MVSPSANGHIVPLLWPTKVPIQNLLLKVCNEIQGSGIQLYRAAYNAVLDVRLQLGMHIDAQELFMKWLTMRWLPMKDLIAS